MSPSSRANPLRHRGGRHVPSPALPPSRLLQPSLSAAVLLRPPRPLPTQVQAVVRSALPLQGLSADLLPPDLPRGLPRPPPRPQRSPPATALLGRRPAAVGSQPAFESPL